MSETTETDTTQRERRECVGEAAVAILGTACGMQLQACEDNEDLCSDGTVIGMISIVGDVDWSIFLGLPKMTAVVLAAKFAGFEIPFDSADMGDAVGELTNILAGETKRRLASKSVSATISLPSVVRAESLEVLGQRSTSVMKTCFTCEGGKLWTGVIFSKEGGLIA